MKVSELRKRLNDSIDVLTGKVRIPSNNDGRTVHQSCPVCGRSVRAFTRLPDFYFEKLDECGHIFSIFQTETINWLSYSCPKCNASDRDRLYSLYLKEKINPEREEYMLDFAPSVTFEKFIRHSFPWIRYRTADLLRKGVDDNVDITQMDLYDNDLFDFIICSHVLEHVNEDVKAMQELFRILKPKGQAIIMVPIKVNLSEDYEDSSITTPEGRWKHFGQHDHVRMYSKVGFIQKLEHVGFKVNQYGKEHFGAEVFQVNGIHQRSILYVVEK